MDWSKKQRFVIRSIHHSNVEHDGKSGSIKSKGSYQNSRQSMEEDCDAQNGGGAMAVSSSSAECSMCGDVGLARNLFRCSRCNSRYQHTYCSNWYPHERSIYIEVCNWCAPEAMVKSGGAALGGSQYHHHHHHHHHQFQHQHQHQHEQQHEQQHQQEHQQEHQHHHHHAKHGGDKEEGGEEEEEEGGTMAVAGPRRLPPHEHEHHHHRLIKKTSKRLVVRRYKFVSEV